MTVEETRRRLGRVGVWIAPMTMLSTPLRVMREQLARIERLGYGSLWTGEPPSGAPVAGREAFAQLAVALAATDRLVIGTGVANIGMRDPMAMHSGAATLAEAYPGRLILGLGGQRGRRPLSDLRDYLDGMDKAALRVLPGIRYPRVLAALGPKAHQLAGERADGVHPFLQPVAHTEAARDALGPGPLLIPHQALVLTTDATAARGTLRAILGTGRRTTENAYTRNYRRLGYGDEDLAGERSDRLIDAVLAWGDEDAVAGRLHEHLAAGADHVLLHPLTADLPSAVDQLERLAGVADGGSATAP
ncbi:TIGR03620 family F420-dependent LLM class oxidoreductase [Streptomyces litchfieldiae]|uniref:TIGR03620 family F420-dependent LLM class oxidoreductase n=1 Tax=Streptomyces litchfieldiae TaxID=3075543 RepID=A0ABU2MR67_9ACTN|nr:TIGR03620 family F420-dependent LLM class oxidoreductase [Streptomyces sp. DSM 44938]MDT0344117.1 TIGR03620 family F420-dependent LLM class oxidoreductase [Streptomyces sp. DSM 44938]